MLMYLRCLYFLLRDYRLAVGALLLVLPNSEPYNKLFTTTEDDHLMAETCTVYQQMCWKVVGNIMLIVIITTRYEEYPVCN
jgi:hypothetical protein